MSSGFGVTRPIAPATTTSAMPAAPTWSIRLAGIPLGIQRGRNHSRRGERWARCARLDNSGWPCLAVIHGDRGVWVLDETTLRPIPGAADPPDEPAVPPSLARVQSSFPGLKKHVRRDSGDALPGSRFAITWETLDANRDRPRDPPWPEPSMLRVIRVNAPGPGVDQSPQSAGLRGP
jgi:hypothetical protein